MKLSATEAFKQLKNREWAPAYLVLGEEPFQVSEIISRFKRTILGDAEDADFNLDVFSGDKAESGDLKEAVDTMPGLFATEESNRLVICQRFEKMAKKKIDWLVDYVEDPAPTTCLLLVASTVDKRVSWFKKFSKKAAIIEVSEPHEREWSKWQKYFEKKCGKKIHPYAWEYLLEVSERKLSLLWKELEKVSLYAGERENLSYEDFGAFSSVGKQISIFDFVDMVMARNKFKVIHHYREMVRNGESPLKLFSLIVRQFRLMEQLSVLSASQTDSKEIASRMGVHPFVVKKLTSQLRNHRSSLRETIHLLAEADYQVKTGGGDVYHSFLIPYLSGMSAN